MANIGLAKKVKKVDYPKPDFVKPKNNISHDNLHDDPHDIPQEIQSTSPYSAKDESILLMNIKTAHFNLLNALLACDFKYLGDETGNKNSMSIFKEMLLNVMRSDLKRGKNDNNKKQNHIEKLTNLWKKALNEIGGEAELEAKAMLFDFIYYNLTSRKRNKKGVYLFSQSPRLILRVVAKKVSLNMVDVGSNEYKQIKRTIRKNLLNVELCINELITRHIGFVSKQAIHFINKKEQSMSKFDDLVQEGNIGLAYSIDRFDSRSGYKLLTFAGLTIIRRMLRYSSYASIKRNTKYVSAYYNLKNEIGRSPSFEEMAEQIGNGVKVETVRSHLIVNYSFFNNPKSLDANMYLDSDDTRSLYDILDSNSPSPEKIYEEIEVFRALKEVIIDILKSNEKDIDIIFRRFGFKEDTPTDSETLQYIASDYGVSRERIRIIQNNAFEILKEDINKERIASILGLSYIDYGAFIKKQIEEKQNRKKQI